jgi:agmatine/peptidylarginine deiminase
MSRAKLRARLCEALGVKRILCLTHGKLRGDDTDGHVDTLARFCSPDTIAYVKCSDKTDRQHYQEFRLMEKELEAFTTVEAAPYRLLALPFPDPIFNSDGRRLPATYANFLIINGAVLMPTYGQAVKDDIALHTLQTAFPDRDIIGIDCRALIEQNGSLHCVTMHHPQPCL